jgi:type II secretion system protein J
MIKGKTGSGFTLVELLLATLVATMVILVALATFRSVLISRAAVQNHTEVISNGRFAMKQIRDDLANFYRSPVPGVMHLAGQRHFVANQAADSLLFYAVSDRMRNEEDEQGDVYEVEYKIYTDEKSKASYLGRRCAIVKDPWLGNDKGMLATIATDIQELKFEYYDATDWKPQWEESGRVPQRVRVSMLFRHPQDENIEARFSQVISLEPLPEGLP